MPASRPSHRDRRPAERDPATSVFRKESPAAASIGEAGAVRAGDERLLNRELSWLAFNRRVLEEAEDARLPLIERGKFLAIVSSNLDEFTMVRLAELHRLVRGKSSDPATREARRIAIPLRDRIRAMVSDQYRCWREGVAPLLRQEGIELLSPAAWNKVDRETLRTFYRDQLEPMLTPQAVDPARPFPVVPNRGICVAVSLVPDAKAPQGAAEKAADGEQRRAIVAVPGGNRLVNLITAPGRFALVEDVVMSYLDRLFPGYRITGRCLFRATRDGALDIDEDDAPDLLSEIEQELSAREHGHPVRLEVAADADPELRLWLLREMDLHANDLVPVEGPIDLTFLFALGDRIDALPAGPRPDLRDAPLPVVQHPADFSAPFALLRERELLLHHPFQSFQRIVDLVEAAAADPRVLAIKQTLYRTSKQSPIAAALARAARAGKQVTVLVELKARFDEAANIGWARALEEAGAHVVYGLIGYKVHAKLLLIVRREEDGIRRYVHLGTGNYNERTARLYTDFSYLTANEAVGRDVAALFNMLTGYSQPPEWERLCVAPLTLRSRFVAWIHREIAHARAGKPARIRAKFNSLVDEAMCEELYAAAAAGVRVQLIVRGMCILRPGVPGLSQGIEVRSLVGRLLEHSRIYEFANAGEPDLAIASADWMTRNLDRRVESLVRIEDPALAARLSRILDLCWADDRQSRELLQDGSYRRRAPAAGAAPQSAIDALIAEATADAAATTFGEAGSSDAARTGLRFHPRRKGDQG